MTAPAVALQKAMVAALTAALSPVRVFDRVPAAGEQFPHVVVGEGQSLPRLADCMNGRELYLDIHVWTRDVGQGRAKALAGQVEDCLHDADLTLEGHGLDLLVLDGARFLRDPDGLTSHVVVTFHAFTQPDT